MAGAKKASAYRIIARVADSFAARWHNLINMPSAAEMDRLARKLEARFPGLEDCPMGIDGTQIEYVYTKDRFVLI